MSPAGRAEPAGASGPTGGPGSGRPVPRLADAACCNRCGFEVPPRAWGCRNPCPNCGTMYPLGDCSD